MKRKLNESVAGSVKIDVVSLVHDYPELQGNIDKLAKQIEDITGASVSQDESDDTIYMVIDGTTIGDIINLFEDEYYIDDITDYMDDLDIDELTNDYPEFDADDAKAARAYAEEDMIDEDMGFDDEGDWAEDWDDEEYDDTLDDMIPDYNDIDIDDDARTAAMSDMADDDDIYSDEYESIDDEYSDDDELNDDSFDECMEDEEFECYESNRRNFIRRRMMNEKKQGCCPPKKHRMVNLSESLKMMKNGVSIKDVVRSSKTITLNENEIKRAINKAKNEKYATLASLKEALGEDKYNTIVKALKEGRRTLYTKKTINGKNLTKYTSKELLELLNTVKAQHTKLVKSYKSLNESATKSTKKELKDSITEKKRLMELLDEELTYRLTVNKMLREEENPLEPLSVDPTDNTEETSNEESDENTSDAETSDTETSDDETSNEESDEEEVELSRVVITVANQEAADELKSSMIDAGIPEDAIEFETEEETEEGAETDSEEETEESAETEEQTDSENSEETPNESIHYNKFKKLLEDDEPSESEEETTEETTGETETETEDDTDSESTGEVKVVLTNTDYIQDLADVLNNEYGIEKEEFEEMIGGTIVDDDSENSDSEEDSEEDSEDEPSTNGDDAVDAMSQEELDKLFGGN